MKFAIYYRTSREDVFAARQADLMRSAVIDGEGTQFANLFNGIPIYTRGFAAHFLGVTFTKEKQPQHPELWTKPREQNPLRMPKDSGIPRRLIQASWELRNLWNTQLPKEIMQPRESELLKALGVTTEMLQAGGDTLQYFERGTVAYVSCTTPLPDLEEILATQYVLGAQTRIVPVARLADAPEVS